MLQAKSAVNQATIEVPIVAPHGFGVSLCATKALQPGVQISKPQGKERGYEDVGQLDHL